MGLLSGGGAKGSGGTRPVPEVPGVGVQLREPPVRRDDDCVGFLTRNRQKIELRC